MSGFPIPARLTVGQRSGWCCVTCGGLADDDAVEVGVQAGRRVFACAGCHREVTGSAVCAGCDTLVAVGELGPGPSEDEVCRDCRLLWSGQPGYWARAA